MWWAGFQKLNRSFFIVGIQKQGWIETSVSLQGLHSTLEILKGLPTIQPFFISPKGGVKWTRSSSCTRRRGK